MITQGWLVLWGREVLSSSSKRIGVGGEGRQTAKVAGCIRSYSVEHYRREATEKLSGRGQVSRMLLSWRKGAREKIGL